MSQTQPDPLDITRQISFAAYKYQVSHEPTPVTLTTACIQGATSPESEQYWKTIFEERKNSQK